MTSVLTHQFLAKHIMAVIPHPPYSPDLAPCDIFLFPKMKLKLKGHRLDTIDEIRAVSRRVLDTDRKRLPASGSKNREGGTGVYMREGTSSRVMAADRPYVAFYDFYSVSSEYFGYILVHSDFQNVIPVSLIYSLCNAKRNI
jgi:hypothetical protein